MPLTNRIFIASASLLIALFFVGVDLAAKPSPESCAIDGYDKDGLMALRQAGYEISDPAKLDKLALDMMPCLSDPDPLLRDKFAYEGYVEFLRNGQISDAAVKTLRVSLIEILASETIDQHGVKKPFAALVLAEVARQERLEKSFTPEERQGLLDAATDYMRSIKDYRGYDARVGWRHGVAHAADLLMQLSLNEALEPSQQEQIRDAVLTKINPETAESEAPHFYIYGEPDRLARPILYLALRGAFDENDWTEWMQQLSDPAPFKDWSEVFQSQEGLAKLHNTKAFAAAIYINAVNSGNEKVEVLAAPALDVLKALP
ncbi:DUF2785 domain-containing protein [Litorimonas haliclonae]|uniref:DUF2785 domain-containing protein n=1 Tax=Litorimonas haliclonae TaxID=2081977 RepID=UPI0039F02B82